MIRSVIRGAGLTGGASLVADRSTFLVSAAQGTPIASLSHPFGGGEAYSLVGSAPGQLTLSADTITRGAAAPVADTNYGLTIRAAKGARAIEEPFVFTARAAIVGLSITGALPAATIGDSTAFVPTIAGGQPPYTLSLASGTLPPGRSLSGLTVTGSYTTAGTYPYTLRVADALGATADLAVSVTVSATAALPAGAAAVWYGKDYVATPRRTVRNRLKINQPVDANLLNSSRRLMANANGSGSVAGSGNTIVDSNAAAPEGTANEASTVTAAGTANWSIRGIGNSFSPGAGQYTVCVSARHVSGDPTLRLGDANLGMDLKTATSVWQRFTRTVTLSSGALFPITQGPATPVAQTIELCDFEVFAGTADLNPNPMGAAPQALQNGDIRIGKNHIDPAASVSGGWIINGGLNLAQMLGTLSLSQFTVVYLARRAAAASAAFQPVVATAGTYQQFTVGYAVNRLGSHYGGSTPGAAFNSLAQQVYPELWHSQVGSGAFAGAEVYDGTTFSTFSNGIKVQRNTASPAVPSVKDLTVGLLANTFFSGLDIAALAIYPRALTSAEVVQAQNAMLAETGVSLAPKNLLISWGTSITYGNAGKSYIYRFAPNATKPVHGVNAGVSSAQLATIKSSIDAFLNELANTPATPQNKVATLEIGANDLAAFNSAQTTTFTESVGLLCDSLKAAGFKVVLHTVTSRTDNASTAANFNANRAQHNAVIRGWAGGRVDAICDIGGSAEMGQDTSPDSTTNFADKVHPNDNGYSTVWEPLLRPIVNALLV